MRSLVLLLVAVNPTAVVLAVGDARPRRELGAAALLVTAWATATAGLSGPLLDLLDVTVPTFQVAAAVVLGVAGVRWMAVGPSVLPEDAPQNGWRLAMALLVTVLLTPQLTAVSISVGAERGVAIVVLGVGTATALSWLAAVACRRGWGWAIGSRFVGLAAVVVALALAVDGVRTV